MLHDKSQNIAAEYAARALAGARCVAVLTGAGISAESGVPTFRDAQTGLWARFDPLQLATPTAFANQPKLVWDWYAWRRQLVASVKPNPAHDALVDIERRQPQRGRIARQHRPRQMLARRHGGRTLGKRCR